MKQSNLILAIAVLAAVVALANTVIVLQKSEDVRSIVGHASKEGTAQLEVLSNVAINFTNDVIDWGSGMHSNGTETATLDSEGTVTGGNWSTVATGLVLENNGNVNASIDLKAAKDPSQFIGGTTPGYSWKLNQDAEAGSCSGTLSDTTYTTVSNADKTVCSEMRFESGNDELEIDIQVVIPEDTPKEAKSDTITATATAA